MAANGNVNGSSLVAVLLVTRSRPGPKLVFHFPPNPQASRSIRGTDSNGCDSDENSESDTAIGEVKSVLRGNAAGEFVEDRTKLHDTTSGSTTNGDLLGFTEESLEKLLSPGCWSDRKKFEVCLDGLTFVGHPIYAAQDGSWTRRHTHDHDVRSEADKEKPVTPVKTALQLGGAGNDVNAARPHPGIAIAEPQTPAKAAHDFTHVPESLDSRAGQSFATSVNSGSSASAPTPEPLLSFNVVFVLANSRSTQNISRETSLVYSHVAKKLSKALNYCQKQLSYIGVESKKLLTVKAKAKQDGVDTSALCGRMIETSELAWALKEVYERISMGAIAGIRLNGMEMSLQIPLADSSSTGETSDLNIHAAILLLEDKDTLLRGLDHPDASPLASLIREHTPTKSLQKHAVKLGMQVNDVLYLARHLMKWQKACTIAPLHPRNTYIVGRAAPIYRLEQYTPEYAQRFSALPSLPQVLKVLSGRPVKYGMLIPSRDHRAPYMDILAYLVRHRFVEQLKTSGWLWAPLLSVAVSREAAGRVRNQEPNKNKRPLSVASLLSPQLRPVGDDDAASVSSERTAIPVSIAETMKGQASDNELHHEADSSHAESWNIITEPLDPSLEDSRRLEYIKDTVDDEELQDRLPSLLQYFNGKAVFEEIAAREGLKRSKLEAWLDMLQSEDFLLTYRHQ
ncbi:Nitrogen permease regulator 3 [Vermiconidia calcicola]|uniref:Nitrogen permease regulator 3 n=1 Tax=Vermiconidia calcicola TaxID=1690605 RepID=A0ACC3ME66_9PEZI|nr:Nitrogen permease regulator 3 [Vermiconidia calcicola]